MFSKTHKITYHGLMEQLLKNISRIEITGLFVFNQTSIYIWSVPLTDKVYSINVFQNKGKSSKNFSLWSYIIFVYISQTCRLSVTQIHDKLCKFRNFLSTVLWKSRVSVFHFLNNALKKFYSCHFFMHIRRNTRKFSLLKNWCL